MTVSYSFHTSQMTGTAQKCANRAKSDQKASERPKGVKSDQKRSKRDKRGPMEPNSISHSSLRSEKLGRPLISIRINMFLRIARSTLRYSDFLPVCIGLYKRMINQGGSELKLQNQIKKALNRNFSSFDFRRSASQIIADIRSGQVVGDL